MSDKACTSDFYWAYAHYFQFVRDKDKKNLIVNCTLCVKPKDLSTSRNSTSNLMKGLVRGHANIKQVTKRKKTADESGEKNAKQQKLTFIRSAMLEPREVRRVCRVCMSWQSMMSKICCLHLLETL